MGKVSSVKMGKVSSVRMGKVSSARSKHSTDFAKHVTVKTQSKVLKASTPLKTFQANRKTEMARRTPAHPRRSSPRQGPYFLTSFNNHLNHNTVCSFCFACRTFLSCCWREEDVAIHFFGVCVLCQIIWHGWTILSNCSSLMPNWSAALRRVLPSLCAFCAMAAARS